MLRAELYEPQMPTLFFFPHFFIGFRKLVLINKGGGLSLSLPLLNVRICTVNTMWIQKNKEINLREIGTHFAIMSYFYFIIF